MSEMKIYTNSLSKTVDSVNEDFFFNRSTSAANRVEVAAWIAARQGRPGSYADMFAPTAADVKNGIKLFTGETVAPSASLRHVSGEEACRALILLKPKSKAVKDALKRATDGMLSRLAGNESKPNGMFCCGTCDPALWRNIVVGGLPGTERWLINGLKALKAHRDNRGKWRRFPFFYTLLALSEIDLPAALDEIKYVSPTCETYLTKAKSPGTTSERRRAVVERVLAKT
jgi:hypothetical protein